MGRDAETPQKAADDSFDDCDCYDGFYKQHDKCVPYQEEKCEYYCPTNSYSTKIHGGCVDSFYYCECERGYFKSGDYCIPEKKKCDYKCPVHSFRKPNRQCYDTFDDCACFRGYYRDGKECVRAF